MIRDYRCRRCRHLLFKGSLSLLLQKQHDPTRQSIETKCPKCGQMNEFDHMPGVVVTK